MTFLRFFTLHLLEYIAMSTDFYPKPVEFLVYLNKHVCHLLLEYLCALKELPT